jgi:hypothetical protein
MKSMRALSLAVVVAAIAPGYGAEQTPQAEAERLEAEIQRLEGRVNELVSYCQQTLVANNHPPPVDWDAPGEPSVGARGPLSDNWIEDRVYLAEKKYNSVLPNDDMLDACARMIVRFARYELGETQKERDHVIGLLYSGFRTAVEGPGRSPMEVDDELAQRHATREGRIAVLAQLTQVMFERVLVGWTRIEDTAQRLRNSGTVKAAVQIVSRLMRIDQYTQTGYFSGVYAELGTPSPIQRIISGIEKATRLSVALYCTDPTARAQQTREQLQQIAGVTEELRGVVDEQ